MKNENDNNEWGDIAALKQQDGEKLSRIENILSNTPLNTLFGYTTADLANLAQVWEVETSAAQQLIQRQRQEATPTHLDELAATIGITLRSKAFFDQSLNSQAATSTDNEDNPVTAELRKEWTRRLHRAQEKLSGYKTDELQDLSFDDRQALASDLQVMEKEIRWVVALELNRRKDEIRTAFYSNNDNSATQADISVEESELGEKVAAEARKAKPLKEAVKQWLPLTPQDEEIWDEIEAHEPLSRCFSRAITQAEMTDIYISGMNSKLISGAKETRANLAEGMKMVLQDFRQDWENKNTERMRQTIIAFMDMIDPNELKASKAFHSLCAYRKYGLQLVHRMSQEELLGKLFNEEGRDPSAIRGICLYATTKHLACKVVGADYRYEKLNTGSALRKHETYKKIVSKGASVRKVLDHWTANFTDAQKRRYEDSVEWGKMEKQLLNTYLSTRPQLGEGEGILVTFSPTQNGQGIFGHAVDVFGQGKGSPPSYFDINLGEYDYHGNNFGRDVLLTIHDEIKPRCESRGIEMDGVSMKCYPLKRLHSLEKEAGLASTQQAGDKTGSSSVSGDVELDDDDEERLDKLYGEDKWELATNKQPPGKDIGPYRAISRDWKHNAYLVELKGGGSVKAKIRKIGVAHHKGHEIELVNTNSKNWKADETTWRHGFGKEGHEKKTSRSQGSRSGP